MEASGLDGRAWENDVVSGQLERVADHRMFVTISAAIIRGALNFFAYNMLQAPYVT